MAVKRKFDDSTDSHENDLYLAHDSHNSFYQEDEKLPLKYRCNPVYHFCFPQHSDRKDENNNTLSGNAFSKFSMCQIACISNNNDQEEKESKEEKRESKATVKKNSTFPTFLSKFELDFVNNIIINYLEVTGHGGIKLVDKLPRQASKKIQAFNILFTIQGLVSGRSKKKIKETTIVKDVLELNWPEFTSYVVDNHWVSVANLIKASEIKLEKAKKVWKAETLHHIEREKGEKLFEFIFGTSIELRRANNVYFAHFKNFIDLMNLIATDPVMKRNTDDDLFFASMLLLTSELDELLLEINKFCRNLYQPFLNRDEYHQFFQLEEFTDPHYKLCKLSSEEIQAFQSRLEDIENEFGAITYGL